MSNKQAVSTATNNFYSALNILFTGNGQPMKDAWSHTDEATYMGPDGLYLIGWSNIEQMWNSVAALKLGGRVNPKQLHTVIGTDMALISCIEVGENEVNGKAETVSIRSSTVFCKKNDSWKVIAHQTDLLGYMS
jgi:ketosteroid isomerase-like protein